MKKTFIIIIALVLSLFVFTGGEAQAQSWQDIFPQKIQHTVKFRLDFKNADGLVSTGRWWSISGGDILKKVTEKCGENSHRQNRPGQIKVKGPFVKDRKAVMDWINSVAQGKQEQVDMALTFLDDNDQPMSIFTLFDVLPITYQPPSVSSGNYDMLEESLTFHTKRIEKNGCQNGQTEGTTVVADNDSNDALGSVTSPSDEPLFGGKFRATMEGDILVTSFSGGGVTFEGRPAGREYIITKVNWANIVLEKNAVQGDTKWKDWFEEQKKGKKECKNLVFEYLDNKWLPVRSIWFTNICPVRYNVYLNVDSRSGSTSSREVMKLSVERAEYK